MTKKVIALLLALVMTLSICPVEVLAAEFGTGTNLLTSGEPGSDTELPEEEETQPEEEETQPEELAPVSYVKRTVDEDGVIEQTTETAEDYTLVEFADGDVTWNGGTYAVSGEYVSIAGDITLKENVKLILCDGATLEIFGSIKGGHKLTVYGQDAGSGVLTVSGSTAGDVTVAGGTVWVSEEIDGDVTMYGGELTAKSDYVITGEVTFYDGKLTAYNANGATLNNEKEIQLVPQEGYKTKITVGDNQWSAEEVTDMMMPTFIVKRKPRAMPVVIKKAMPMRRKNRATIFLQR